MAIPAQITQPLKWSGRGLWLSVKAVAQALDRPVILVIRALCPIALAAALAAYLLNAFIAGGSLMMLALLCSTAFGRDVSRPKLKVVVPPIDQAA